MNRFWKASILGVVLLALGGVAAGIVAAQTGGTSTPSSSATSTKESATATESDATAATKSTPSTSDATPGKREQLVDDFLTKLAANLGVSVDDLKSALTTTHEEMIDQAVADGKITQDEADKLKAKIESGDFHFFPFGGHGKERGDHGRGPFGFGFFGDGDIVAQTADLLGVDRQAVLDGLMNGQSLAQIAEANGKTADGLSNYIYDQLKSKLDQAVQDNKVTQEREDSILTNAKDRINQAINNVGFRGHWDGDGDNNSNTTPGGTADPSSL